jgi:hypothetical protein
MRSIPAIPALLFTGLALAGPASGAPEDEALLAAPGKCAEARHYQGTACTDCGETAASADDDGLSVAGPASGRFSPNDVAAPAAEVAVEPPSRGSFEGRGPCDSPGSGCLGTVQPAPQGPQPPTRGGGGVTVVERPPNPGGPPGR